MSATNHHGDTYVIALPLPHVLKSGMHLISTIYAVVVEIEDDGVHGVGYSFTFGEREAAATKLFVQDLLDHIAEEDWHDVIGIHARLWRSLNHVGQAGPPMIALAAIDTALWDLNAKRVGLPLYQLWGGGLSTVPAYASGGWLSYSIDQLLEEATSFADMGFDAYKMKIGNADISSDVDRVRRVQEAVGPGVKIMVDANQSYSRTEALQSGRQMQDLGVYWFEEPLHTADFEGSAQVAAALDMRVATGETVYGIEGMKDLVRTRAADVIMPDLMRLGGLTPMRTAVAILDSENLEIAPHLFPEISAHVMAAVTSGGRMVEFMPRWWAGFLSTAPGIENGSLALNDLPGLGIEINPELPRL